MSQPAAADALMQELVAAMRLHKAGDFDGAARAYEALLKQSPAQPELLKLVFDLCLLEKKADRIESMVRANPNVHGLRRVAARLYQEWKDYNRQLEHLDTLYQQDVRSETFYDDYARALKNNGLPERCLAIADEALAKYPQSLELLKLRANAHFWLGHHKQALADGEAILLRAPDDHYVRTTVGSLKLMLSGCTEGFEEYAAHGDYEITRANLKIAADLPQWRGSALGDTRLLLWCSQGIGDVVMFAGLIPWAIEQGAHITLAVYAKSVPLFARSFSHITVTAFTPELLATPNGQFDFHSPLGQLMPYALPQYTPAEHPPYLKADAGLTGTLRKKYQAAAPGKKLVGISWHTINPDTFSQRNIPLKDWQPLFDVPGIQLVSLQYGDHAKEIDAVNAAHKNAVLADKDVDAFGNTDALAAQIAAMDEVVSIQNSTVHVAGALGVPTTILLSAASEWRWGTSGSSNRWYGSVTVERQEKLLEWDAALTHVRNRLKGA